MKVLLVGYGYVGSFIAQRLAAEGHDLTVCSRHFRSDLPAGARGLEFPYQTLEASSLEEQDAILWFAGHSSVNQALKDPDGAVRNNCFDLLSMTRRKHPQTRLIYASTASLYSLPFDQNNRVEPMPMREDEAVIKSLNAYDSSKSAFDALVAVLGQNTTGLRLGTVCGMSPQFRPELIFNAMNLSALRENRVCVSNGNAWRSIVFLDDLAVGISNLLKKSGPLPQFLNVANFNIRIAELARQIANWHGVPVHQLDDTQTYSFRMNLDLAQEWMGSFADVPISERCRDFVEQLALMKSPA